MIIVISSPLPVKGEHEIIRQLFDAGLDIFHLRKKTYSEHQLRNFIENISYEYFHKIVLHSHFHLAGEYNLRGMHITSSFENKMINGKKVSTSFHSPEEIEKTNMCFDYGFLSPVFDSISKEGYRSNFDLSRLKLFLSHRTEKIIALGGIDEDKIEIVQNLRFSGIALLGAIWQNGKPVEKLKLIKEKWEKQIIVY